MSDMYWNNRIVDMTDSNYGDPWFEVREVWYEGGKPTAHSNACLGSESPEQVIAILQRMIDDIRKNPEPVKFADTEIKDVEF